MSISERHGIHVVSIIQAISIAILAISWVTAAVSDFRSMTIPNIISIVMIVAFVGLVPFSGLPLTTIVYSALTALMTFLVCFGLFASGAMGGGDAKLLTASALWFGFSIHALIFFINVALLGGLLTLIILFLRAKSAYLPILSAYLPSSLTEAKKIPYGIAIAAGGIINLENTLLLQP